MRAAASGDLVTAPCRNRQVWPCRPLALHLVTAPDARRAHRRRVVQQAQTLVITVIHVLLKACV